MKEYSKVLSKLDGYWKVIGLILLATQAISIATIGSIDDNFLKVIVYGVTVVLFIVIMISIVIDRASNHNNNVDKKQEYSTRNNATPQMLLDFRKSVECTFIGISNTTLDSYLSEAIHASLERRESLPVERIGIYFCNYNIGEVWEGGEFGKNIGNAIYRISLVTSSQNNKKALKDLKEVSFYQMSHISFYGGSTFSIKNSDETVMYIVHYMLLGNSNTKTSFTQRISSLSQNELDALTYVRYSNSNNIIDNDKSLLYEYKPNLWDISANAWSIFEKEFSIYRQVMNDLTESIEFDENDHILELCCGTGYHSKAYLNKIKNGRAVMLDSSPQMLEKAMDELKSKRNVSFILGNASKPLIGEFRNYLFDKIFIIFSIQYVIGNNCTIREFLYEWKKRLKPGGEIIIVAHNSVIECSIPPEYSDWEDPFRKEMEKIISSENENITIKQKRSPIITDEEVEQSAKDLGLKFTTVEFTYHRTMEDRACMWKAPAIFNSIVDFEGALDKLDYKSVIDKAFRNVRSSETMPTTVKFINLKQA